MDSEAVLDFAVEVGYQLLISGGEIYRAEESISRILTAYGLTTGEVFAIPNCIMASISTDQGRARTRVRRIPNHGTDIYRLEAVNDLCRKLCAHPVPVEEASARLAEILEKEPYYSVPVNLFAHFIGAGTFGLFFGGSWQDGVCAGLCGMAIGVTVLLLNKVKANLLFKTIAGAAVSALMALLLTAIGFGRSVDLITIGALMILVPGIAFTNAVRDIMVGDMVSGLSKFSEAILIGTAMALGTGFAMVLAGWIGGLASSAALAAMPMGWIGGPML